MNIQKVKEALDLILDSPDDFLFTAKYLREHIEVALKELEAPEDEDYSDIIEYLSDCQSGWSDTWQDDIKNMIWHHIESYHAKKCSECVGQLPAFPHRKQYYPLGQEPYSTSYCLKCRKANTCDLPMDCQGNQYEPEES